MLRKKEQFDYQLDLTPFISLLSVCICFLLLTVAWVQIGALSVKQVMGSKAQGSSTENKTSLWIYIKAKKRIEVRLKKGAKSLSQKFISSIDEDKAFNFKNFQKHLIEIKKKQSNLKEAFILPQEQIAYEDIIKIMDGVRQVGIFSMGLSPI